MLNAVFVKSDLSIDEIAASLREILNISPVNRSPGVVKQNRYGLNYGGHYYHFDILGLTLELIQNKGEVQIDERSDWDYYVLISGEEVMLDEKESNVLTNHITRICAKAGLLTEAGEC